MRFGVTCFMVLKDKLRKELSWMRARFAPLGSQRMVPDPCNIDPVQVAHAEDWGFRRGSPAHLVPWHGYHPLVWRGQGKKGWGKRKGRNGELGQPSERCCRERWLPRLSHQYAGAKMNSLISPFLLYVTGHVTISVLSVETRGHEFDVTSLKPHN